MDNRAEQQNPERAPKYPIPVWPTAEMLQDAKRARGRAFRDMILAPIKWAKAFTVNQRSRDMVNTDALRGARKR
jgi:hypothetical protein